MKAIPNIFSKAQISIFRPMVRRCIDPFFVRHHTRLENIYHCTQQRCGSRWILHMLRDIEVYKHSGLDVFNPRTNYIAPENYDKLSVGFPLKRIISPVYARYGEFEQMPKPNAYRAFSVVRDARDLVVSKLYSQKYSHEVSTDFMRSRREILSTMDDEEGISFVMEDSMPGAIASLKSWCQATQDKNMRVVKYEDLVGANQLTTYRELFDFLDIQIPDENLRILLDRYSFARLSGGRSQREEDLKSHYRKGTTGDWREHFTKQHRDEAKSMMGDVLIEMGYEQDFDW